MAGKNRKEGLTQLAGQLESLKFKNTSSKKQKTDAVMEYLGYIAGVCDTIIGSEKVPSAEYKHPSDLVKEAMTRLQGVKNDVQRNN